MLGSAASGDLSRVMHTPTYVLAMKAPTKKYYYWRKSTCIKTGLCACWQKKTEKSVNKTANKHKQMKNESQDRTEHRKFKTK